MVEIVIYLITNLLNGKKYVGQTSLTVAARWQYHIYASRTRNGVARMAIAGAIRKHGPGTFSIIELERTTDPLEANRSERRWIAKLRTTDPRFGYNIRTGGNGPINPKAFRKLFDIDVDLLHAKHTSGISIKKLAEETGFSRPTITKYFAAAGLAWRSHKAANVLVGQQLKGRTGRPQSQAERLAASEQRKGKHYSPTTEIKPGQRINCRTEFQPGHHGVPEDGLLGSHRRWHVNRGIWNPDCRLCFEVC